MRSPADPSLEARRRSRWRPTLGRLGRGPRGPASRSSGTTLDRAVLSGAWRRGRADRDGVRRGHGADRGSTFACRLWAINGEVLLARRCSSPGAPRMFAPFGPSRTPARYWLAPQLVSVRRMRLPMAAPPPRPQESARRGQTHRHLRRLVHAVDRRDIPRAGRRLLHPSRPRTTQEVGGVDPGLVGWGELLARSVRPWGGAIR